MPAFHCNACPAFLLDVTGSTTVDLHGIADKVPAENGLDSRRIRDPFGAVIHSIIGHLSCLLPFETPHL